MPHISVNGVKHYYDWITQASPVQTTTVQTRAAQVNPVHTHNAQSQADHPPGSIKPVMVFVHGWAGSARYWRSTAMALSDTFDCLLYDMRGFGRSAPAPAEAMQANPELGTIESFAEDLKALLDALGLPSVYLNAHSLGGSAALYFLERYPSYVRRAILTCNGSFEYQRLAFKLFHYFGGYVVALRPHWLGKVPLAPHLFMSRFLKRPIPYPEKVAFLNDFLLADGPTALGTLKTAVSHHATVAMPKAFAALDMPTLMVSGQYDKITPAPLGQQAAALNPNITYLEVSNTAHFPMLEDADTYLQAVRDFLQVTPASSLPSTPHSSTAVPHPV